MRHASKRAIRVSIHASAREATFNGELSGVFAKGFNPRLRTGGDLKALLLVGLMVCFNPRLRTGGDTQKSKRAPASCVFQSTPPHGRRHRRRLWTHRLLLVSIHASAREATSPERAAGLRHAGFNPRLRTGGDVAERILSGAYDCFNPRLRTGGDIPSPCGRSAPSLFQSTPPHGRRPKASHSLLPS